MWTCVWNSRGAACQHSRAGKGIEDQQRQGISTGLASSVSSSRKATQTRTVRETKHTWLDGPMCAPQRGRGDAVS